MRCSVCGRRAIRFEREGHVCGWRIPMRGPFRMLVFDPAPRLMPLDEQTEPCRGLLFVSPWDRYIRELARRRDNVSIQRLYGILIAEHRHEQATTS